MSKRCARALAWSIIAAAVALFSITTWPVILYLIPLLIGFAAVMWALITLASTCDD